VDEGHETRRRKQNLQISGAFELLEPVKRLCGHRRSLALPIKIKLGLGYSPRKSTRGDGSP